MSGDSLLAALSDLVAEPPPAIGVNDGPRLLSLIGNLAHALSVEDAHSRVEAAAEGFLGSPPSEVLEHHGPPDWWAGT